MDATEERLATALAFVQPHLPAPPARVLEIGCGSRGGFVPTLNAAGYQALGVDPEAPEGPEFRQVPIEEYEPDEPVHAVIASASLHHVADLAKVRERIEQALLPGGTLVVLEWAWERMDAATARWCFARVGLPEDEEHPGWLHWQREQWMESGQPWEQYLHAWAAEDGMHPGEQVIAALDAGFDRRLYEFGPHFHPHLAEMTEADELAAIEDGNIQATGIRYVAIRR